MTRTVYFTPDGACFHTTPSCAGGELKRQSCTLEEAAGIKRPCPTCVSDIVAETAERLAAD